MTMFDAKPLHLCLTFSSLVKLVLGGGGDFFPYSARCMRKASILISPVIVEVGIGKNYPKTRSISYYQRKITSYSMVERIWSDFILNNQVNLSNLETVKEFYSALIDEVIQAGYNSDEISLLGNTRRYYGRYLNPDLRNYFVQTVIPHIADAISYFCLMERPNQYILDLGCGLGMQSLIFASLGAKVVAVDICKEAISLCKKRKAYYEEQLKLDLDVEFHRCDFRLSHQRDFDVRFDGLFSMSAFSYITPLERIAKFISSILKDDAKIFLYEENATCLFCAFGGREVIPSPENTVNAFNSEGFNTDFLYGGCSLPSFFWSFQSLNRLFLHPFNNLLRKSLYLSFNYVLGMKRRAG